MDSPPQSSIVAGPFGWRVGLKAGAAACGAGVIGSILLTTAVRPAALLAGILFLLLCLVVVISRATRNGGRDIFSPVSLMTLYMSIGIGGKGLANLLANDSRVAALVNPVADLHDELLLKTFTLAGAAVIALLLGDLLAAVTAPADRSRLRRHRPRTNCAPWMVITGTLLTALGTLPLYARHGTILITSPGSLAIEGMAGVFWAFPLTFGGIFGWGFAILEDLAQRGRTSVFKSAGYIVVCLFVFLITSSKAALLSGVLIVLVGRHMLVRPLGPGALAGWSIAGLLSLPLLYAYRAFGISSRLFIGINVDLFREGALLFFNRGYMADAICAILLQTPSIYPYKLGAGYLEILYFWIPRSLWPDKPMSSGLDFGSTYFSSSGMAGEAFFSPTLIGDSYMNFGWPGVIIVFVLTGFVLRRLYDHVIDHRGRTDRVMFYAAAVYFIALAVESSLAGFVSLTFSYLAVALLVINVRNMAGAVVFLVTTVRHRS